MATKPPPPPLWERFGTVQNFVEPFFGSGAVLLGCAWPGHTETVNDADGLLANFWRATAADGAAVAHYADWPVNEADLHARRRWLVDHAPLVEQLLTILEWYRRPRGRLKWVWGISQVDRYGLVSTIPCRHRRRGGKLPRQLPTSAMPAWAFIVR